jgi:hypothetical protein
MKDQLKQEINLLWESIKEQRKERLCARVAEERLGRLVVILRDLEAAEASANYAALTQIEINNLR